MKRTPALLLGLTAEWLVFQSADGDLPDGNGTDRSLRAGTRSGATSGPVTVSVSFDEYNLDAEVSYIGTPHPPLPEKCPSKEEILNDFSATLLPAGFLIRAHTGQASSTSSGGLGVLKIEKGALKF